MGGVKRRCGGVLSTSSAGDLPTFGLAGEDGKTRGLVSFEEVQAMLAPRGRSRTQVGTTLTRSSPAEEMMSSGSEVHMVFL